MSILGTGKALLSESLNPLESAIFSLWRIAKESEEDSVDVWVCVTPQSQMSIDIWGYCWTKWEASTLIWRIFGNNNHLENVILGEIFLSLENQYILWCICIRPYLHIYYVWRVCRIHSQKHSKLENVSFHMERGLFPKNSSKNS